MPASTAFLQSLPHEIRSRIKEDEPLWRFTTLRVGGPADLYYRATDSNAFARIISIAQKAEFPYFVLGGGSNVCIADSGVRGLVVHNESRRCDVGMTTRVDSGYSFMKLFLDSARNSLSGLEFAVGIPGSVGGAMVSNAGAYRQNICDLVVDIDVVEDGERTNVASDWMGFSYRDSRLRRAGGSHAAIVAVTLKLEPKSRIEILARARDNQRQRIFKQPWHPSAGSFFKNVYSRNLADELPNLPIAMKEAGVVPSGFLNGACGCKGLVVGGAQISRRHANFVVNRGNATAEDIQSLTRIVKQRVRDRFGVELEEEVLFAGDWPANN